MTVVERRIRRVTHVVEFESTISGGPAGVAVSRMAPCGKVLTTWNGVPGGRRCRLLVSTPTALMKPCETTVLGLIPIFTVVMSAVPVDQVRREGRQADGHVLGALR